MLKFLFSSLCLIAPLASVEYMPKDFTNLIGMKGFNDDLLKMHFQLYEGYVKNTNLLLNALQNFQTKSPLDTYEYGSLKRRLGWEFDGMRLHELYFDNLGGIGGMPKTNSALSKTLVRDFGSYEQWKKDFIATALMRGIGWVILYQDMANGQLINTWIAEHDLGHLATCTPLLVLDVWEHAYLTQYGLDRNAYVQAFMDNINWDIVEKRLPSTK
jgi:superoxide dismutase, Fe-Mn family